MLDALTFLPVDKVAVGIRALRETASEGTVGIVDYIDTTYVSGSHKAVVGADGRMRFRRTAQRLKPGTSKKKHYKQQTSKLCESWNLYTKYGISVVLHINYGANRKWSINTHTILNCIRSHMK